MREGRRQRLRRVLLKAAECSHRAAADGAVLVIEQRDALLQRQAGNRRRLGVGQRHRGTEERCGDPLQTPASKSMHDKLTINTNRKGDRPPFAC